MGMIWAGAHCLPGGSCTCSLCIPNCGGTEGRGLFIGSFGVWYQHNVLGIQGHFCSEQLPHGCIHLSFQSENLIWQCIRRSLRLQSSGDIDRLVSFWHRGQRKWPAQGGWHWCYHQVWIPAVIPGRRWPLVQGMSKPVLYRPSEFFATMEGGAPWAADVGLPRMVCTGTEPEVLSMACDSSSWSSTAMLVLVVVPLGHSMAECGQDGDVEIIWGLG